MAKRNQKSTVVSIIADILLIDDEQVTPGAKLGEELEIDSIDFIDIIMTIEEKLGLEIDEEMASACVTVGDIERLVERSAVPI